MRCATIAGVVLALTAAGCNKTDSRYAPVSGVVTLNGKPYAKAVVTFQPAGGKGNINPGRGSFGVTDAEGRFTLKTDEGVEGAVIGMHQIKIRTEGEKMGYDPQVGSEDSPSPEALKNFDPIPTEWRTLGKNTFEVPPGGTKDANFDIKNPKLKN